MRNKYVLIFVSLIVLLVIGLILFVLHNSTWDGESRYRYAMVTNSGAVYVAVAIPNKNELQIAKLKPDSEVEAAHGLGKWKISSLLKLGEQEKIGGTNLIRETLIQGFGTPIEGLWIEDTEKMGRWQLISGLFSGSGDIKFETRIRLSLFLLNAPINLWDNELAPENILALTREPLNDVAEGIITIVDRTGTKESYLNSVSFLIENLGGKVLNITDEKPEDGICTVHGKSVFAKKLSLVLQCEYKQSEGVQELVVNKGFLNRY